MTVQPRPRRTPQTPCHATIARTIESARAGNYDALLVLREVARASEPCDNDAHNVLRTIHRFLAEHDRHHSKE